MHKTLCFLLLLLLIFTLNFKSNGQEQTTLTLATTKWCPYTCVNQDKSSNIIGRYIEKILLKHDINLKIETYPWSRAIKFAEQGKVDGLLTATHSEAPSLNFTTTPISYFQVCFYANKSVAWQYSQPIELQDYVLGVIQDYGYDENIDQYIAENSASEQIMAMKGDDGSSRLLNMLVRKRVDVIVEDKLVLQWQAAKNNIDLSEITNVGCSTAHPFYLALNKSKAPHQKIIDLLNKELAEPENHLILKEITNEGSR